MNCGIYAHTIIELHYFNNVTHDKSFDSKFSFWYNKYNAYLLIN